MTVTRLAIRAATSASCVALTVATAMPAAAQAVNPNSDASADVVPAAPVEDAGEIVVTGSRISREGFTAPTPVTTVGEAEIQLRAPTNLGDTLATIPSFRATNNASSAGVNTRGGGIIAADLRGLAPIRTLVLVNGRRFIGSGSNTGVDGVVDLKLIPTLLVSQVEVVTGGASAAWGSDAVAGVVNFILKDKMDGLQGTVQAGVSQRGDNAEHRVSLAGGHSFADDMVRFVAGVDYVKNEGVPNQYSRGWGRKEYGLVTNPAFATNGLPQYIISPSVRPSLMTPGGLITSGPLRGIEFLPSGQTRLFNFGTVFGTSMIGGDNYGNNLSNASILRAPMEAVTGMARLSAEISPAFEPFVEVNAAYSTSGGNTQQPRDQGNLVIQRDNAYLPTSVRDQMVANNLQTIAVGRLNNDSGPVEIDGRNRLFRGVLGAKGEISGSWRWDAYYQYGRNRYSVESGPNNRIVANYLRAIDAVESNGQIVCRSTLTNPANGCIPINIFGDGSVQVNDYAFGTATYSATSKQHVAAANVNGDLFENWAGPVSFAVGAEYRKEEIDGASDAISTQPQPNGSVGGFLIGNQLPINGGYNVWEVYAETVLPLLRDSTLGRALELNGAVRRTDYSISGVVETWKVGFSYQPFDDLRIRGTRSRDIRAPNLGELFQAGGSSFTNVFDPVLNQTVQIRELLQGNLNLKPEKADTWTAGLIYQPAWLPGLSLSLDYYDIKVSGVIGTISSNLTTQRCFAGLTQFCQSIVFNADGTIGYTLLQNFNLNALKTSGLDFEARYDTRLFDGRLSLRALGTYVDKLITIDAAGPDDRVGKLSNFNRTNGVPHFTGTFDVTYSKPEWLINLQTRLIGKGKYNPLFVEGAGVPNSINKNNIPAYAYLSLTGQVNIDTAGGQQMQLFATIDNLTDTDPPFMPSGTLGGANETSTNPSFYDVIGRTFKFGLRFKI